MSLSGLVFLIGALALGGLFFKVPILMTVRPGLASMKINAAIGLMLEALSLSLVQRPKPGLGYRSGIICAAFAGLFGLFTLSEYAFGINLGIDDLLVAPAPSESDNPFPSRMSPITAFCLVCASVALLRVDAGRKRSVGISEIANLAMLEVSILGLVGYVYGAPSFYRIGPYTSLAVHTGFAFLILGVGIFAARREQRLIQILTRGTSSAVLAIRR